MAEAAHPTTSNCCADAVTEANRMVVTAKSIKKRLARIAAMPNREEQHIKARAQEKATRLAPLANAPAPPRKGHVAETEQPTQTADAICINTPDTYG